MASGKAAGSKQARTPPLASESKPLHLQSNVLGLIKSITHSSHINGAGGWAARTNGEPAGL